MFGGLVLVIAVLALAGPVQAGATVAVLGLALAALSARDRHHRNGLQRAGTRGGWWRTRRKRAHIYAAGPFGQVPYGTYQLPGLLAPSTQVEWRDVYDRPFSLLHVPGDNSYAVTLSADPDGASLVDQGQINQWVAHYGLFLAGLAAEPNLVGAAVTVETAPDSGTRLHREVETNTDPNSHDIAQAVLAEVVRSYPIQSSTVRAYASMTFAGAGRKADEVGRELSTRMPGLTALLAGTGAGAVRPMSAAELNEVVRVAYDPAMATSFDASRAVSPQQPLVLPWDQVGPARAEEGWDFYRHDSGVSTTWVMTEPPRGEVPETVLQRLLEPQAGVTRKRVTFLYRPLDPAAAARTVERDQRNAESQARRSPRSARAAKQLAAANRTAEEEARGAALVNFAIVVTATVADPERLPRVRATVENLAVASRLTVRPVYGGQATAFAAALPLGLVTSRHVRVPAELRAAM